MDEEDPDDILDKQMADYTNQFRKPDPTRAFIQDPKEELNF